MTIPQQHHRQSTKGTSPRVQSTRFGHVQFEESEFRTTSQTLNRGLGPEFVSTRSGPGGTQLAYIEGWKAINVANDVFAFNGWSSSIEDMTIDFLDCDNGRYSLGLSCTVRVTLKDGSFHEDIGYGSIENARSKGQAFEKAKKEAVTDALKRALRYFGNVLGNCLYDKNLVTKSRRLPVTVPEFKPEELYRHASVRPVPSNSTATASSPSEPALKHNTGNRIHSNTNPNPPPQNLDDDDDFFAGDLEMVDPKFLMALDSHPSNNNFSNAPNTSASVQNHSLNTSTALSSTILVPNPSSKQHGASYPLNPQHNSTTRPVQQSGSIESNTSYQRNGSHSDKQAVPNPNTDKKQFHFAQPLHVGPFMNPQTAKISPPEMTNSSTAASSAALSVSKPQSNQSFSFPSHGQYPHPNTNFHSPDFQFSLDAVKMTGPALQSKRPLNPGLLGGPFTKNNASSSNHPNTKKPRSGTEIPGFT